MDSVVKTDIEEPVARLPAGSVVLTKIRGFQPWPSMILKDEMAPSYLTRKKPKNIKVSVPNANGKKGSTVKSSNEIYLVRFFHDDTYQWVSRLEITEMGPDADVIEDFKQKQIGSVKKMPKSLELAYNVAKKGLTLKKFSEFGSYGGDEDEDEKEIEVVEVKTRKNQPIKKSSNTSKSSVNKNTDNTIAANNKKRKAGGTSTETTSKKRSVGGLAKTVPNGSVDIAVLSSSGNANFEKREEELKELEAKYKEFIDDSAWKSIPLKNDSKRYIANVKSQMEKGEQVSDILVKYIVDVKEGNLGNDSVSAEEIKKQLEKLEEMRMYMSVSNKLGLNMIMVELSRTTEDAELKRQLQKTCLLMFGEDLVV